jgi:hypothetical protein
MSEMVFIKADGFDDCIVGVDLMKGRIAYSKQKMVEQLVLVDGMSWEEAVEYLEFNTWSAYIGENTPIYLDDYDVLYMTFAHEEED